MHSLTETSTRLLTMANKIISRNKTNTEYTRLPTRYRLYRTIQRMHNTRPDRNEYSSFASYRGTQHITCAAFPRLQMRAYTKNRLLRLGRTGRALQTQPYTRSRTTCTPVHEHVHTLMYTIRCTTQVVHFKHCILTRTMCTSTRTRSRTLGGLHRLSMPNTMHVHAHVLTYNMCSTQAVHAEC